MGRRGLGDRFGEGVKVGVEGWRGDEGVVVVDGRGGRRGEDGWDEGRRYGEEEVVGWWWWLGVGRM